MPPHALCVGLASVELVGQMPRFPVRHGDRQELSAFSLQGGGAAATAAVTLATLGARVTFGGALPNDFLGDFAAAGLAESDVALTYLKRIPGGVAPISFVALDEEKRRPTVFWSPANSEALRPSDVPPSVLDDVALLLVDGAFPAAQLALVQAARERRIATVLSAHTMLPGMTELAAHSDVVIASERFSRELAPAVSRSLVEILRLGAQVVVVTLGEDGSVGLEQGKASVRAEPRTAEVVDPTGAGDVYRGAFAWAWLQKRPLLACMQFASAAATLKCQHYGAREGIPDLDAVERAVTK